MPCEQAGMEQATVSNVDSLERTPLLAGGSPGSDCYGTCTDDDAGAQADAETGSSSEDLYFKPESDQEFSAKKRSKRFTCKQLVFLGTLAAITMTASLTLCIFPPFFPKIAEDKGFSVSVYGLIIGTNCLVSFIVTPFLGRHIESLGLGFTLISGTWASGIACVLCGMLEMFPAGMPFVYTAIAIRTVQSIGNAGIIITTFAYTNMLFPTSTGVIFALNRTVMSVAQMLGPALGGIFYELGGYYTPFVVFGILHLLSTFPLWCVLPPQPQGSKKKHASAPSKPGERTVSVWGMLKMHSIWVAFTTFFVSTMSTGFLSVTLEAQILRKYELSHVFLGMMFGLKDGASTITSPIWGILCDKFYCVKSYIAVVSLTAAICFALFGPIPGLPFHQELWMIILGLSLYGIAIGGMQVSAVVDALREAINNGLPDEPATHGVVTGMWSSLSGGGRFISRCGAGIVVDTIGFPMSAGVIVILHLLMAAYAAAYSCLAGGRSRRSKTKKSRRRHAPSVGDSEECCGSPASSDDLESSPNQSGALQVPGRRSRHGSDGRSLTYLTASVPDCARSYNELMGE